MSMRPPVDRQRIIHFLQHLGQRFRRPGRVYFAEILPQVGERSLKDDPVEFERKFAYLGETWAAGRE